MNCLASGIAFVTVQKQGHSCVLTTHFIDELEKAGFEHKVIRKARRITGTEYKQMGEGGKEDQTAKEGTLYVQNEKKQTGERKIQSSVTTRKLQIIGLKADPRFPYR